MPFAVKLASLHNTKVRIRRVGTARVFDADRVSHARAVASAAAAVNGLASLDELRSLRSLCR